MVMVAVAPEPELELVELVPPLELLELVLVLGLSEVEVVDEVQLPELGTELLVSVVLSTEALVELDEETFVPETELAPLDDDSLLMVEELVPELEAEEEIVDELPVELAEGACRHEEEAVEVDEVVAELVTELEVSDVSDCVWEVVDVVVRGARPAMNEPTAAIAMTAITMVAPNEFEMPVRVVCFVAFIRSQPLSEVSVFRLY
jgi:hypothetical protein